MNPKYWLISIDFMYYFFQAAHSFPHYEKVLMVLFRLTIYHESPSGEIRIVIPRNQHIYLYSIHFTSN